MPQSAQSPALVHQFETKEQQHEAGNLGMWVFLVTEIMFFGGAFMAYIVYRALHLESFITGSHMLDVTFGATNTVVLICSSLTMALAIHAAQTGKSKGKIIAWLLLTMFLGALFLALKFRYEWYADYLEGIVPGISWNAAEHQPGVQLFMCFYFFMTGLHA